MSQVDPGLHYPLKLEEMPKGWKAVYVGDAATEIRSGFASGKHNQEGSGIPHLRPMNVSRGGKIDLDVVKYVDPGKDTRRLSGGDVLFNNTNSAELIGKTALVKQEGGYAYSNHMTRLRFPDSIDPAFVAYQLHFLWMCGYFLHKCVKHVNQASISAKALSSSIPLIVPPLPEQRRIVARIEALFARLNAGVAELKKAKAQLKRYRQAVLAAAVTGELTKEWREHQHSSLADWKNLYLGDISEVKTGKTPKRGEREFWTNGNIPWLTSSATNNHFTDSADQFVTQAALNNGLKLFNSGTLLLAMYGEGKTRGQVTEITIQATCNQACAAILVDEAKASKTFVRLRLQENYEQTRKAASGGNQPNLNLTKVREIPVHLPPLAEQHQIVAEVEARTTAIDHLEAELDRQITRSNRLRQATLARAFARAL